MSQAKDRELLRRLELISRIKPSAESTDRAMAKAREALLDAQRASTSEETSRPRILRLLHLSAGVKAAIAAVVVTALSVGIVLWNSTPSQNQTGPFVSDRSSEPLQPGTDRLQYESDRIKTMVARRDTQGLIDLMDTALPASRLVIAGHLQEWADETAVDVLQRYAKAWTGHTDINPYAQAVAKIQQRLTQNIDETETSAKIGSESTPEATPAAQTTTSQAADIELQGYVTDKLTGQPIADAHISVAGPSTYDTRTDADGFYSLDTINDSGPYQIKVTAPGYLGLDTPSTMAFMSLAQGSQTVKHFQLEKGCLVNVMVTDEGGRPVDNARVTVSWLGVDHENDVVEPVTTDANGQAIVGPVKTSEIAYHISAAHKAFAPQYTTVQCLSPEAYPSALIVLPQGQTVEGYAEYADGVPAHGVDIVARPHWWNSIHLLKGHGVDENGRFNLTSVEPDTYRLFARFRQPDDSLNETELTRAELPPLDDELLTITLPWASPQPRVSISGPLLWADEKRPDFVDIIAYSTDIRRESTIRRIQLQEDLDRFEINGLIPGQYHLYFEGINVQPVLIPEVNAPVSDLEVALTHIPAPGLSGTVVRADTGEGIEDFTLTLLKKHKLPGSFNFLQPQHHRFPNTGGKFQIQRLGPGTYDIQVHADGYVPAKIEHVVTDNDRPLYIELSEGGSVMGHVIDHQGRPVTGARVVATAANALNPLTVKTQTQEGDFLLEHVPEGLQTIKITHPDHGSIVIDNIDVSEGLLLDLGHISLFTGATVEGIVLDRHGLPAPNSTIMVEDKNGQILTTAVTNEFGFYETIGLPANRYQISLIHPDPNIGIRQYGLQVEQDQTYPLDFTVEPRVVLSVRVVDENQLPLISASAWLEDAEGTRQIEPLMQTDTELIFIADAGDYTLRVEHNGYRSYIRPLTVDPNHQMTFNPERPVIQIQLQPN